MASVSVQLCRRVLGLRGLALATPFQRVAVGCRAESVRCNSTTTEDSSATSFVVSPEVQRGPEDDKALRARLVYQSRKRGIKENDLLMSTFVGEHVESFGRSELEELDIILNKHDNEWDMYKWMIGNEPLPEYLQTSGVMQLLVEHSKNKKQEVLRMPNLPA
eukprot:m.485932 g.485932  ORF g.485932 m.485932 type:complete len:162 (+) comp24071_c0_seq1:2649-3134(+)